jgi:flagellar basal-body rod protein FlgG
MRGQQTRIDVVSNNLANVNTTGFKGDRAEFTDLIYQQLRTPGGTSATGNQWPTPLEVGLGVKVAATAKDFKQGNLVFTDQPLDMAIQGDGFFQVDLGGGRVGYTRDGSFKKDVNGDVVNSHGQYMLPSLNIPADATSIGINSDGTVSVIINGDSANEQQLGNIELVRFSNPQGLQAIGNNLFVETPASGPALAGTPGQDGLGGIQQGAYEASNVSVVDELVQLIVSQRAFEANSKSVQTSDDMLQVAVNLKR